MNQMAGPLFEIRGFKWPKRPTAVAGGYLLGEDQYGRWVGIRRGDPWWTADGSRSGVFEGSFVKLVPRDTYWTACFNPVDPVIDVDIVLPVHWTGNILEEVDVELDILRLAEGSVHVRDQDEFARVQTEWGMPSDIAAEAEATSEQMRAELERSVEPFANVGQGWLARFLVEIEASNVAATRVGG